MSGSDCAAAAAGGFRGVRRGGTERNLMGVTYFAGAAYRALTASKVGPSLYDLCDPLFHKHTGGDAHIVKFYKTALGNPALRPLLCRAGLPELRDPCPVQSHTAGPESGARRREPRLGSHRPAHRRAARHGRIEPSRAEAGDGISAGTVAGRDRQCHQGLRRASAALVRPQRLHSHLRGIQPDRRSRHAWPRFPDGPDGPQFARLQELDAAVHFSRVSSSPRSPAGKLINPPWTGIAEPMWEPVQIRHRSAYYDAFLHRGAAQLRRNRTAVAGPDDILAPRHRCDG